jgi:carboxymethylenebutenolidase
MLKSTLVALILLAAPARSLAQSEHTGAVPEEEFKALHELSKEKAPPAKGTMIEVAKSRAYLSLPKDAKPPIPGIVVIQEWWGLNDHMKHWADRLAAEGYAALAVDLYGGKVADNPDSAMAYVKRVDEKRALEILRGAHAFLASDPRVRATKRASIGWCFGGGWSLRLAMAAADLDAAVIYYGRLETDPKKLAAVKAHILGVFGNEDQSIPPQVVDQFAAALDSVGIHHQILRYDAPHAFANPSSPRYDQASATDAWKHVQTFLAEHLRPEEGGE